MVEPGKAEFQIPVDSPISLGDLRLRRCGRHWMLYRENDVWIGRALELFGSYSGDEARLFHEILTEGDVVVEAGANIGCLTVPIAERVAPTGVVHAFEPQHNAFKILCANLVINGLDNVTPRRAALGDEIEAGFIPRFTTNEVRNFGDAAISYNGPGDAVEILTIDSLGLQRCDLIKIDVQGMERDVLMGAGETIQRCRPIIYAENDNKDNSRSLIATIMALGYVAHWHLPTVCEPPELAVGTDFEDVVSINLLCLPTESRLQIEAMARVEGEDDWPL